MEAVIFFTALVVIIYIVLAFLHPRTAIYLLIFLSIFNIGFFSRWIGATRYLARSPYILACLLAVIFILEFFTGKLKIKKNDKIVILYLRFIIILLTLSIYSAIYNRESIVLSLYELRNYFMLPVFLIGFCYYVKSRLITIDNFILFCVLAGLVQIPVTAFQYIMVQVVGIRLSYSALDMVSGTFTEYSGLVFMQCIAIAIILEYQFQNKKPLLRFNNYFIAGLLIIPLLLSNSRSAMGFVILTVFFSFGQNMFKNSNPVNFIKKAIILTVSCTLILFAFFEFFWPNQRGGLVKQLNPTHVKEYFFRKAQGIEAYRFGGHPVMGRGRAVIESAHLISGSFINILIGMGSGSASEASFINKKGRYFQEYGPLAGIGRTQLSKSIVELGFLGLFLLFYFFIKIYYFSLNFSLNSKGLLSQYILLNMLVIVFSLSLYAKVLDSNISILIISYLSAVLFKLSQGQAYEAIHP